MSDGCSTNEEKYVLHSVAPGNKLVTEVDEIAW